MSDKRKIDDIFREGLDGLSSQPSPDVWKNIEKSYPGRKFLSGRNLKYALVALVLLLAGFSGWYFYDDANPVSDNKNLVESPQDNSFSSDEQDQEVFSEENEKSPLTITGEESYESTGVSTTTEEEIAEYEGEMIPEEQDQGEAPLIKPEVAENKPPATDSKIRTATQSIYGDIGMMEPLDTKLSPDANTGMIDPQKVKGMEEFLEKRKKSHFYTGLNGMAGMMYYPSTRDQFTWSADLAFGLTAGRFYFETGIGYQDIREKGTYTIELRSYDSVGYYNEVQSFEVNPLNPNEIWFKTEEVTVYDSITHFRYAAPTYRYAYLNLPLIAGYRIFHKDKLTVGLETGIQFSYLIETDRDEVDATYPEYTLIKTTDQTPERVDLNYRWLVALRLDYRLARSMSVSVKPVFNKYLNSIYDTKKGYPDVRPYSMGLQVGINFGF